jgi:DNA-binding response OmpR family regulator
MAYIRIIDDDEEFADNIALILKKEGHTVEILNETEGAVESLAQKTPDLLILDVMFPENPSAGFDLARKIRQTEEIKNLRVIMLTGVNQEFPMDFSSDDIDPDWIPVQDFVDKSVDMSELLAKINKLLES